MSMTLAQLWQIVADAKNDLHVVEQELAKLVDEEEKLVEEKKARKDVLPVYENFLPVGTYLLSEEEHRQAPIGTWIAEKDLRNDEIDSFRWEKTGPDHWSPLSAEYSMTYGNDEIWDAGPYCVNVVVEKETAKLAGEKEKQQGEQTLPVGTALVTHEDHEKAPIGTLIREHNYDTDYYSKWSWRKVGPDEWEERDPDGSMQSIRTTATVTQVLPHIVNTVVYS